MSIAQRTGRRVALVPLLVVLALGTTACDTGDGGIGEEEFAGLEERVGGLEEDLSALQEEFNTLQEEAGLGEEGEAGIGEDIGEETGQES